MPKCQKIGKLALFLFLLIFNLKTQAQKTYNKSIGILSENDSYMLMGKDGYYTNGLTLSYSWTKKDTSVSMINTVEVGQLMYNARNGSYQEYWEIDRPVTAYLFGRYCQTRFLHQDILVWNIGLGMIGPNALGRQVQLFMHKKLGMYKPQEWPFQLKNSLALDGSIAYIPKIFEEHTTANFYPVINSNLGMTFTNMAVGFFLTIGKKNANEKSFLWNTQLNETKQNVKESFFYFRPIATYYLYNATVQGSLFSKDAHAKTLNRFVFTPKLGWQYAYEHFSLNLGITYTGREARDQLNDQWYGSIQMGWRW